MMTMTGNTLTGLYAVWSVPREGIGSNSSFGLMGQSMLTAVRKGRLALMYAKPR